MRVENSTVWIQIRGMLLGVVRVPSDMYIVSLTQCFLKPQLGRGGTFSITLLFEISHTVIFLQILQIYSNVK